MEAEFWHGKWERQEIGFHQAEPNDFLVAHFGSLGLSAGDTVLVPLCGKSLDVHWILQQGLRVIGVELDESAVISLFRELGMRPSVRTVGEHKVYEAGKLQVFQGDILTLNKADVPRVDGVYDRAAMVALPESMRCDYCSKLVDLALGKPIFLITFDYPQDQMPGPPFSISAAEISQHYQAHYRVEVLGERQVEGKLKGLVEASEVLRLLRAR